MGLPHQQIFFLTVRRRRGCSSLASPASPVIVLPGILVVLGSAWVPWWQVRLPGAAQVWAAASAAAAAPLLLGRLPVAPGDGIVLVLPCWRPTHASTLPPVGVRQQ